MSAVSKITRTELFNKIVSNFMHTPPPATMMDTSCEDVLLLMRKRSASTVIITSSSQIPIGIVTAQDIIHRSAFLDKPETPVSDVMTSPVQTISNQDFLFHSIARMNEYSLRSMPVVDSSNVLCGIVYLDAALSRLMGREIDLIKRLSHSESIAGLAQVKQAEVEVVEALMEDGVPAHEVQQLLSHINNDIYKRIIHLTILELNDEGWGLPPIKFSVIVMGSCGRDENFLYPDQDYGFILSEYPSPQQAMVEAYFVELSKRMSKVLDQVGFPFCKGQVMAHNSLWCNSLSGWYVQVKSWLAHSDEKTLRLADIFFDFQHIFGEKSLADSLKNYVTDIVKQNHAFLKEMQRVQQDHGVCLNMFGKLSSSQEEGIHKGTLNLKYHGILPLVEAVRLLALREGIKETSTLQRIAILKNLNYLSHNEYDYLHAAFGHLTYCVLQQQISDYKQGVPVNIYVPPESLTDRESDLLIDSLNQISELRSRIHAEYTADVF